MVKITGKYDGSREVCGKKPVRSSAPRWASSATRLDSLRITASTRSGGSLMIGDEHGVDLSGEPPERHRLILALLRYQSLLARNSIAVAVSIRHLNEWMEGQ